MAQKEVELLDKVLLRLALTGNDKMPSATDTYLMPVLSKLLSPHEATRIKAVEVLQHMMERIRPLREVRLPLAALLDQYASSDATEQLRSFVLDLIEIGAARISPAELADLAPRLLAGISRWPRAHQTVLLNLVMPVFEGKLKLPTEEPEQTWTLLNDAADRRLVLEYFLDVLLSPIELYVPPVAPRQQQPLEVIQQQLQQQQQQQLQQVMAARAIALGMPAPAPAPAVAAEPAAAPAGPAVPAIPPGLSEDAVARLKETKNLTSPILVQRKLGILTFVSTLFTDNEIISHLLVAAGDVYTSVSRQGEELLKRLKSLDLESEEAVARLYSLYQGTVKTPATAHLQPSQYRTAASTVLKMRILTQCLSRSERAANTFPAFLHTIFDALFAPTTTDRLRQAGMVFTNWVSRVASEATLAPVGNIMLGGLRKLLQQYADADPTDPRANDMKASAYSCIGILGKRLPALFVDGAVILTMFSAMAEAPSGVRTSIHEALLQLWPALRNAKPEVEHAIFPLLKRAIENPDYHTRYLAVTFATRIFPFQHVKSRLVCLLASQDTKSEVADVARKGLQPYIHTDDGIDNVLSHQAAIRTAAAAYPAVSSMALCVFQELQELKRRPSEKERMFDGPVFDAMVKFLLRCKNREVVPDAPVESMPLLTDLVSAPIQISEPEQDLDEVEERYAELIYTAASCSTVGSAELQATASFAIWDFVKSSRSAAVRFASKLAFFKQLLQAPRLETREWASKALGLIAAEALELEATRELAHEFIEILAHARSASGAQPGSMVSLAAAVSVNSVHGAIAVLGEILAACITLNKDLGRELYVTGLTQLYLLLSIKNNTISSSACDSIGTVGLHGPLPIPDAVATESDDGSCNKTSLLNAILKLFASTENQVVEAAVLAAGKLCVGEPSSEHYQATVIEALLKLAKNKRQELHFSVGDALAMACARWHPESRQMLSMELQPFQSVIERVIAVIESGGPVERSAASTWLLSLTKNTGSHVAMQATLPQVQTIFTQLLADPDEVIQEIASKGLVLVHEHGSADMKQQLVKSLVSTLAGGAQGLKKGKADNTIFPQGALGGAEADGLSTYQELCSVATELGQPELVYKFLNLASHNAMWNSRKGAAFAAQALATSAAKAELEAYLPSLVPKLYRYSYDPNPRVAQSMAGILAVLVSLQTALDKYWEPIVAELLEGMGSRLWRVREGCAVALGDAVQSRSMEVLAPHLEQMFYMTFRVMDDIKETVRQAGLKCARSLAAIAVRLCDVSHTPTEQASKAASIVLPFLLKKGITNDSEDVRKFAMSQLTKVCKVSRSILSPYVADILGAMLEALSMLEPAEFNYFAQHASKMGISQEALEKARLTMARVTPMTEILSLCVGYVEESNLDAVCQQLTHLLRHGVGLPAKVGTAKFVSDLVNKRPATLKPKGGKLLNALMSGLTNPSASIRTAFADAIGHVTAICVQKRVQELVTHLVEMYTTKDDDVSRCTVAYTLLQVAIRASDSLKKCFKDVIPVAFLGRSDPIDEAQKSFERLWEEIGIGQPERLYTQEIVRCISSGFVSSSWNIKKQSAASVSLLADSISLHLRPYVSELMAALLDQLPGRIWTGKAACLCAIGSLVKCMSSSTTTGESAGDGGGGGAIVQASSVVQALLTEASRKNDDYRRQAIVTLGEVLAHFASGREKLNHFVEVANVLYPLITQSDDAGATSDAATTTNTSSSSSSSEDDKHKRPRKLVLQAASITALGKAWPADSTTQREQSQRLFDALLPILAHSPWNIKAAILATIGTVFASVIANNDQPLALIGSAVTASMPLIRSCVCDNKFAAVKEAALKCVESLMSLGQSDLAEIANQHREELEAMLRSASADKEVALVALGIKAKLSSLENRMQVQ